MHFCEFQFSLYLQKPPCSFELVLLWAGQALEADLSKCQLRAPQEKMPSAGDTLSLGAAPGASAGSKLLLYACRCARIIWKLITPQTSCKLPTAAAGES